MSGLKSYCSTVTIAESSRLALTNNNVCQLLLQATLRRKECVFATMSWWVVSARSIASTWSFELKRTRQQQYTLDDYSVKYQSQNSTLQLPTPAMPSERLNCINKGAIPKEHAIEERERERKQFFSPLPSTYPTIAVTSSNEFSKSATKEIRICLKAQHEPVLFSSQNVHTIFMVIHKPEATEMLAQHAFKIDMVCTWIKGNLKRH